MWSLNDSQFKAAKIPHVSLVLLLLVSSWSCVPKFCILDLK